MNELKKLTPEQLELLKADFPKKAYMAIPGKTYLTTLKAYYVTERLNDVFGVGRWTIDHEVIKETDHEVLMKGTLKFFDYDLIIPMFYGSGRTTGKNIVLADGYKSAITDIMSKCSSFLGIGHKMFKGLIDSNGNERNEGPNNNYQAPDMDREAPKKNNWSNGQGNYKKPEKQEAPAKLNQSPPPVWNEGPKQNKPVPPRSKDPVKDGIKHLQSAGSLTSLNTLKKEAIKFYPELQDSALFMEAYAKQYDIISNKLMEVKA